jgi:hypothetical protein
MTRQQHAAAFNTQWRRSVEAIIEAGRALIAAERDLEPAEFAAMLAEDLLVSRGTAVKLKQIAGNRILCSHGNRDRLPNSWTTLYALSELTDAQLRAAFANGRITPDMQRRDAEALRNPPVVVTAPAAAPTPTIQPIIDVPSIQIVEPPQTIVPIYSEEPPQPRSVPTLNGQTPLSERGRPETPDNDQEPDNDELIPAGRDENGRQRFLVGRDENGEPIWSGMFPNAAQYPNAVREFASLLPGMTEHINRMGLWPTPQADIARDLAEALRDLIATAREQLEALGMPEQPADENEPAPALSH